MSIYYKVNLSICQETFCSPFERCQTVWSCISLSDFTELLAWTFIFSLTLSLISIKRCSWKYRFVFCSGYSNIRIAFCPYIMNQITKVFITNVKYWYNSFSTGSWKCPITNITFNMEMHAKEAYTKDIPSLVNFFHEMLVRSKRAVSPWWNQQQHSYGDSYHRNGFFPFWYNPNKMWKGSWFYKSLQPTQKR